ncbi:uncharacterized protein BP5553_05743 [Venustampulla echinocandica]|uniref:Ubiquitin-like protease family profile domain-containing protein n=1 Tax=Venustampulla echinocandica TaxID=2656787 RepID=A0A370TLJ6_9HELO|nr:uncharacterized protein BP5553_05743 [Venustampulla echinocandica]RDL36391.1 hypothetical protein BP5553_05743 [Venustampulla echinocandica]
MDALRDPDKALPSIENNGTGEFCHEYDGNSKITKEDKTLNIEKDKADAEMKWNDMDQGKKSTVTGHDLDFKQGKGTQGRQLELEASGQTVPVTELDIGDAGDTGMEPKEGELRRLMVDEEPNHKRTSPNPQLETPTQLQAAENKNSKKKPRPHSEEPSEEPCAKKRRLLYSDIQVPGQHTLLFDDEAGTMQPKSPGKKKRKEHSTDHRARAGSRKVAVKAKAASEPPGSLAATAGDSEGSYENDGEVLAAKRVRPNTTKQSNPTHNSVEYSPYFRQPAHGEHEQGPLAADTARREGKRTKPNVSQQLVQHNSEIERANSPSSESKHHADAGLAPYSEASQTDGNGKGNVQEPRKPTQVQDAPRKKWKFANRYNLYKSTPQHERRRSENSTSAARPPQRQTAPMKPRIPGSLKPMNRLGGNISVVIPPLSVETKLNLDHSHSRHPENNAQGREQSPAKRRRIDDKGNGKWVSSTPVIELDPESPPSQTYRENSTIKPSLPGYEQQSQRRGNTSANIGMVGEFQTVEAMVNPQNQKPRNKLPQTVNAREQRDQGARLRSLSPNEDQDDPISDGERTRAEPKKNSVPRVEIPSYKGNAFRKPARNNLGGYLNNSRSPRHVSVDSNQATGDQKAKKRRLDPPSTDQDENLDIDDLAADHYIDMGKDLAEKKRAVELLTAASGTNMIGKRVSKEFTAVDESSEDDYTNSTADIKPTKFNKAKQTQKPNETKYALQQIFSKTHKWLTECAVGPWILNYKKDIDHNSLRDDVLQIIDRDEGHQFDIRASTINKIEFDNNSGKMVLHRSKDLKNRDGHQVFLELSDAGDSLKLRSLLEKRRSDISYINKTTSLGYLEKTFERIKSTLLEPKSAQPSLTETPTDIDFLTHKAQKRRQQTLRESEEPNIPDITPISNNGRRTVDERGVPRAKGLAKGMRTYSTDSSTGDGIRQSEENGISPNNFYGTPGLSREPTSHATRSTRRVAAKDFPSQQRPKSRSPSPPGWTREHPDWEDEWHGTVVYPPEGRNKANVDKPDIERLDEGEFLNDSLINFYIRWLQHGLEKSRPDLAKRIYFQNSFFYERLTSSAKGRRGINYEAVQRWTAKVDLFEKDYIVVPVCENLHWYVAIICNAPRLLNPEPDIEAVDETSPVSVSEKPDSEMIDGMLADLHTETVASSNSKPASSPPSSNHTSLSEADLGIDRMSLRDRPRESSEHSWPDECLDQGVSTQRPSKPSSAIPIDDEAAEHVVEKSHGQPTAKVVSDLLPSEVKKTNMGRKGKRASMGRKYDPNDPRIITLDSLGSSHSRTCTNLRDYLLAELKAKHGKEISPVPLGMTAKNIPEQHNFSDCGLFLLSYVEKFLETPDDFIRGILQNQHDVDMEWPKASEMRNRIRKLLFELQREQFGKSKKPQKSKRKEEDPERFDAETGNVSPVNSAEHEVSGGAEPLEHVENSSLHEGDPLHNARATLGARQSTEIKQDSPPRGVLLNGQHESKDGVQQPRNSKRGVFKADPGLLSYMSRFAAEGGQEEEAIKGDIPKSGKSESDAVEIGDSPTKTHRGRRRTTNDIEASNHPSKVMDSQQEEYDGLSNGLQRTDSINEIPSSSELIEPKLDQSSQHLPELSSQETIKGSGADDAEMLFSGRDSVSQGAGPNLRSSAPNSPVKERCLKRKVRTASSSPVATKLKSSPRFREKVFAARDSSDNAIMGKLGKHTRFSP